MYRFLAQLALISDDRLYFFERIYYYMSVIFKASPFAYFLYFIGTWIKDNEQFAAFICVALLINMAVGVISHTYQKSFNWVNFFKGNITMIFVLSTTYLMLEMLRYTAGENIAGEIFKVTIQLTTLFYPTSKVLKNIFILSSGKYPPDFIMKKLYNFEKNGDLSEFFNNKKQDS